MADLSVLDSRGNFVSLLCGFVDENDAAQLGDEDAACLVLFKILEKLAHRSNGDSFIAGTEASGIASQHWGGLQIGHRTFLGDEIQYALSTKLPALLFRLDPEDIQAPVTIQGVKFHFNRETMFAKVLEPLLRERLARIRTVFPQFVTPAPSSPSPSPPASP